MTRVAIYARFSSDNQRDASIEDQLRICRERAKREGWQIIDSYSDRALSGSNLLRPGIQALMQDAQNGQFDIVLAESLDRISRDQEDVAGVYKRFSFADIKIVTLSEGEINELHIGLKGTMGALYLKDLADKTRRGLRGRIENGKSGGGNSYGYDVVKKVSADGTPERGDRTINPFEATIVRRIFSEYAKGKSPRKIAHQLNKEEIAGPRGSQWGPSTLHGNVKRGTGILNNEMYIGRLVWNRLRYIKNPETGKRVSRLNPQEEWIVHDVPDLRIIDEDLWKEVKTRQTGIRHKFVSADGNGLTAIKRNRYLFSGLIKCASCGGGFSIIYRDTFGCSTMKNKGTCTNDARINRQDLERRILLALRENLMQPDLFAEFCDEYTKEMNRLRTAAFGEIESNKAELARVLRKIDKMIDAVADGFYQPSMKPKMESLEHRRLELEKQLETAKQPPALVHPNMTIEYRKRVKHLYEALKDEKTYLEASEAIRNLVGQIIVSKDKLGEPVLNLQGDLAGILTLASNKKAPMHRDDEQVLTSLVAGVGFEPTTFRL